MQKKTSGRLRAVWVAMAAAGYGALLLLFPEASARGAGEGLSLCAAVIIPSLFPFMALTTFLIQTGTAERLGRVIEPLTRFLFALPGCAGTAILMGFVGGYPVGARAARDLWQRGAISRFEFSRILLFCVNAGPAFMIGAVGGVMLHSPKAGMLLYAAQVAASTLIGVCSRFFVRGRGTKKVSPRVSVPSSSVAEALIGAVADTASAMPAVCGFVVLFASLSGILTHTGTLTWAAEHSAPLLRLLGFDARLGDALLPAILEVTGGCVRAAEAAGGAAIPLIAAATGWGGLSVQCQVLSSCTGSRIPLLPFFGARALSATLTAVFSALSVRLIPDAVPVLAAAPPQAVISSSSIPATVALLLLSAMAVLYQRPEAGVVETGCV